ncbi:MAG: hypothetical protein AB1646_01475 [Thermodesulfobacteriota bacterium]
MTHTHRPASLVRRLTILLLTMGLVISVLIAWGMRFLNEDLYVAFLSGRDTLHGLLGTPDQWSFNTGGAVWVDQAWLSHLTYYLSYLAVGAAGPVLLKGLLLGLCLWLLYGHCTRNGRSSWATLLALILATLSLAPFYQIRAENFGLLCFVVLLLMLSASPRWGRLRHLGALAVLGVWGNCHGSVVLGVGLVSLRAGLDFLRWIISRTGQEASDRQPDAHPSPTPTASSNRADAHAGSTPAQPDPLGWCVTLLLSVGVLAFVNPYGPANVSMPFRQLSATSVTSHSTDWVPLLDLRSLRDFGLFQPLDVAFFVGVVLLVLVLVVVAAHGSRKDRTVVQALRDLLMWDGLLEVLIPLLLVVTALRFRRIILFASVSMIPLLAWLLDRLATRAATAKGDSAPLPSDEPSGQPEPSNLPRVLGGDSGEQGSCEGVSPGSLSCEPLRSPDREPRSALIAWMAFFVACSVVAVLGLAFVRTTVVPYLPGNPMRPDGPLVSKLMSFDSYTTDVARFMKQNAIRGRVLATWTLSNYLLFHVPGIQVFMDCRDQSAYSDEVIRNYFLVLNATPQDAGRALEILDRSRVEVVVLATNPRDFRAATLLMATGKWPCVYKDEEAFLLVRSDSARFGPMVSSGNLDGLTYSHPRTKTVSTAVLRQFMTGSVPPELVGKLQQIVLTNPDPNLFSLIALAMNGPNQCLNAACREYLASQAELLAGQDFMIAGGAKTILESLVRVLSILHGDEVRCRLYGNTDRFGSLRQEWELKLAEVRQKYLGYRVR